MCQLIVDLLILHHNLLFFLESLLQLFILELKLLFSLRKLLKKNQRAEVMVVSGSG